MEIDGFHTITDMLALAKELYDIGRFEVVKEQFFDSLCYDNYYENILGCIMSVFSGFYNDYNDDDEAEIMVFTDDYISRYYEMAWEYGRVYKVSHEKNPYVIEARNQARQWLSFCYSTDYKLLGYTRTRKAARQSKLVVYMGMCDCDCHTKLAYGLLQLYQFFKEKCTAQNEVIAA